MYNKSHHTHTNSQLLKSKVYFWVKLNKNNEFSDKELNFIFFSVFFSTNCLWFFFICTIILLSTYLIISLNIYDDVYLWSDQNFDFDWTFWIRIQQLDCLFIEHVYNNWVGCFLNTSYTTTRLFAHPHQIDNKVYNFRTYLGRYCFLTDHKHLCWTWWSSTVIVQVWHCANI